MCGLFVFLSPANPCTRCGWALIVAVSSKEEQGFLCSAQDVSMSHLKSEVWDYSLGTDGKRNYKQYYYKGVQ